MTDGSKMEFEAQTWQPQTTMQACKDNTSPEVLCQVLTGFLQTVTGLPWTVRVDSVPVEVGDVDLQVMKIRAMVSMAVPKDRIGGDPDYTREVTPVET